MNRLNTLWQATRLHFSFPVSAVPALIGGLVAVKHAGVELNLLDYLLAALGAMFAHAATNLLSDYFDFRKGVDKIDKAGTSLGSIVSGRMTPRQVLVEALFFWALSAVIAIYFLFTVGVILLPLIAFGLILGAGYTGAPVNLKYRALGDISVFFSFGLGITLGAYVVQTGQYAWAPIYYGIPVGLLIWAVLHANNLRDIDDDKRASIKTVALLLGARGGGLMYVGLLACAYLSLVILVASRLIVPAALLAVLTIPLALGSIRQVLRGTGRDSSIGAEAKQNLLTNLDMRTAQLELAFSALMLFGLLGHLLL